MRFVVISHVPVTLLDLCNESQEGIDFYFKLLEQALFVHHISDGCYQLVFSCRASQVEDVEFYFFNFVKFFLALWCEFQNLFDWFLIYAFVCNCGGHCKIVVFNG